MPKPPASLNKASETAGAVNAVASDEEAGTYWIHSPELEVESPKETPFVPESENLLK